MGGFEVVAPRYAELYERAVAVAANDVRVVRVETHGSVATGTADEWSDLDIKVIVRDDDHGAVVAEWRDWLDAITPTVWADTPIAPFVVNSVTDDGLTFDMSFWPESLPDFPMPTGLQVGFLGGKRHEAYPPAVEYAVFESLRGMSGPLIKFLKRGEHVAHLSGIGHSLTLLQAVLLAERDAPIDARKPASELSPESLAVIAALPPVSATYDALLAFELAIGREVITRGKSLFVRYGLEWPKPFERVAATNLREQLGVAVDFLDA